MIYIKQYGYHGQYSAWLAGGVLIEPEKPRVKPQKKLKKNKRRLVKKARRKARK